MEKISSYERVIQLIEKDCQELVDLCLKLGNTVSPNGRERAAAETVVDWFKANEIEAFLQPITETSCNAVGVIRGSEDGTSLIVDAHIDTTGSRNGSQCYGRRQEDRRRLG